LFAVVGIKAIQQYHDRVITAVDVIRMMMEVRNGMQYELKFQEDLGLSDEEVAFYHIVENLGSEALPMILLPIWFIK
jgi:type I restriction enzyme R subunit